MQRLNSSLSEIRRNLPNVYNIKLTLNYLESFMLEFKDEEKQLYQDFFTACNEYVEEVYQYLVPNQDGTYKLVDENSVKTILEKCGKISKITNSVKDINKDKMEGNLFIFSSNCKKVEKLIAFDINALMKVTEPSNFVDIIAKGRKKVIDVTGKESTLVGANMSSRQIIDLGNNTKGVFTKSENTDPLLELRANVTKYKNKYPQYQAIFDAFDSIDQYRLMKCVYDIKFDQNGVPMITMHDIKNNSKLKGLNNLLNSVSINIRNQYLNACNQDPDFKKIMYQFFVDSVALLSQYEINHKLLRINTRTEIIAERNSAMSTVAELLHIPNVIAHSENIKLINNGVEEEGVLMEFAKGKDISKITGSDPIRRCENKAYDLQGDAFKSIADLQVLDYICGNIDRHLGNMFYQFDESDPQNIKFLGVQGIDNDSSFIFGDKELYEEGKMHMTGLDNLNIIDEKTANWVRALTPDILSIALQGYKMSQPAIQGACERLKMLQEKLLTAEKSIDKQFLTGKLYIVPNNENGNQWDRFTLRGIVSRCPDSYFTRINSFKNSIKKLDYDIEYIDREINKNRLALLDKIKPLNNDMLEYETKVDKGTLWYRGTSKQYKAIEAELQNIKKKVSKINATSTDSQLRLFGDYLTTTSLQVQAYLNRKYDEANPSDPKKKPKKHSEYTKKRIKIMEDYYQYLSTKGKEISALMNKKDELVGQKNEINQARPLFTVDPTTVVNPVINKGPESKVDNTKKVEINPLNEQLKKDTEKMVEGESKKVEENKVNAPEEELNQPSKKKN